MSMGSSLGLPGRVEDRPSRPFSREGNFELPADPARSDRRDVTGLLKDEGIVRNREKIDAAIANAQRFLEVRAEYVTFAG
ncbi:MAG: DNA-3-methyladenine glycosylase I [Nitrospirota bacterium]